MVVVLDLFLDIYMVELGSVEGLTGGELQLGLFTWLFIMANTWVCAVTVVVGR